MTGKPRVVLVTGASAGIGLACADLLHAAGWTVIGASRRGTGGGAPAGPAVRAPAAAAGGWAGLVMDVDDDDSVRDGVRGIIAAHGRIDAIVAAAGWGWPARSSSPRSARLRHSLSAAAWLRRVQVQSESSAASTVPASAATRGMTSPAGAASVISHCARASASRKRVSGA